ncbi:MAG: hypothetical protein U9O87_02445 [Verrucomicrobiota bacterium]|nr:hypothetical protein [Verrucomicrobiota bacterium]
MEILQKASIFDGRTTLEEGLLAGYSAIIATFELPVPISVTVCMVS